MDLVLSIILRVTILILKCRWNKLLLFNIIELGNSSETIMKTLLIYFKNFILLNRFRLSVIAKYLFYYILNLIHALTVPFSHPLFLIAKFLVFIGLHIDTIHGAFQLINSFSHLKFVLQVLGFVCVCSVIVFFAKLLILLNFTYQLLKLNFDVLLVLSHKLLL